MGLVIFLVALVFLVIWAVRENYHRLVTLRHRYKEAYNPIHEQLQQRYDLIAKWVEAAKRYMKYDQETLEAVIAARHLAMQANNRAAHNPGDPQAMQQLENAEAVLAGALGRLRMLSDTYPHLKTDRPMTQYVEKLTLIENRIAFARQAFNEAVMLYNTRREAFPSNLIASLCNFRAANLLEEVAPEVIPTLEFRLPFA